MTIYNAWLPVLVSVRGRTRIVSSPSDALVCMQVHWPAPSTARVHLAIQACKRAMAGGDDHYARITFVDAAREAEILEF